MLSVCLAILNYNGRSHLEFLLPTAIVAADNYPGECSIVVLDNLSTDQDVAWVEEAFPAIGIEVALENEFLFSYNDLALRRNEDVLVILNNDLMLQPDFVTPLIRHFANDDVFAVSATSRDWDDQYFTCGPASLKNHHGWYHWGYDLNRQELCYTLFCSGGFMAVDRIKFVELEGFNRLFSPAYCEDLDLCFRAWRKGWRCIFEPNSVVLHRENGSWGAERANRFCLQACLLFQWAYLPAGACWWHRQIMRLVAISRITSYPRAMIVIAEAWWQWSKKRRLYKCVKMEPQELEELNRRIDQPLS